MRTLSIVVILVALTGCYEGYTDYNSTKTSSYQDQVLALREEYVDWSLEVEALAAEALVTEAEYKDFVQSMSDEELEAYQRFLASYTEDFDVATAELEGRKLQKALAKKRTKGLQS